MDGLMLLGWPGWCIELGSCRHHWYCWHQHNISSIVCCDCIILPDPTLQTYVILVCGAFGGSVLYWRSRGKVQHHCHWIFFSFFFYHVPSSSPNSNNCLLSTTSGPANMSGGFVITVCSCFICFLLRTFFVMLLNSVV